MAVHKCCTFRLKRKNLLSPTPDARCALLALRSIQLMTGELDLGTTRSSYLAWVGPVINSFARFQNTLLQSYPGHIFLIDTFANIDCGMNYARDSGFLFLSLGYDLGRVRPYSSELHHWHKYYRQTSNISRTKSHNFNVSSLFLQLFLPSALKPEVRMNEYVAGAAPTGDTPTTSEWQIYCLQRCVKY